LLVVLLLRVAFDPVLWSADDVPGFAVLLFVRGPLNPVHVSIAVLLTTHPAGTWSPL